MAPTELARRQQARVGGRDASDLTDAEWALFEALMPSRKTTGRPRKARLRDVFDAIPGVATTGCPWRMLPNDVPPVSTVRDHFYAWCNDGLLVEITDKSVEAAVNHTAPLRAALQPATSAISLGQQDTLAGDEGLAQTEAGVVQEADTSPSGM